MDWLLPSKARHCDVPPPLELTVAICAPLAPLAATGAISQTPNARKSRLAPLKPTVTRYNVRDYK